MPIPEVFFCPICSSVQTCGRRLLPGMAAYVCKGCVESGKTKIVSVDEIDNKVKAPWRDEEVRSLAEYQASHFFFPFQCDENHFFVPTAAGLLCKECKTVQAWAYDWNLNWSWKSLIGD